MSIIDFPTTCIDRLQPEQEQPASEMMLRNWRKLYRDHVSEEVLRERNETYFLRYLQDRRGRVWSMTQGARIIGIAATGSNCIDELWIDESQRRKGHGSGLLRKLMEDLGERGFNSAQVGLEDFNQPALAFFGARSWSVIGSEALTLAPGKRVNALVLSTNLNLS